MDFNEIITFQGGLNTDDTPQSMPKGDYRDFSYCRLGYNSGNAFAVETSNGTIEITNYTITTEDKVLGAAQWIKENAIVYFLYKNTQVHEIWVYYISTQTHRRVIQNTVLNFSSDWPIFHANVIDDILKWTDGRWDPEMYDIDGNRLFNPPYQINLRKALDGFYTVIDLQTIDAIKWPMEPPIVSYFTDPTRNDNKLRGKLFKFIIQPIYENGELGVWSMYSNLALPDQSELVSGTNWVYPNNDNLIKIQFDTGPNVIRGFNLAVQQYDKNSLGATPPFGVFLQLDKLFDNIGDNEFYTVDFYGNSATSPAIDVLKNYDRLPITADCQEYLPTNQITYTNFREGYDKPINTPFTLNVQMGYEAKEILWNPSTYFERFKVWVDDVTPDGTSTVPNYNFYFTYEGDAYADVNTSFIFQVNTTFQFVSWSMGSGNLYADKNVFYSISQNDVNNALAYPTPYDQNAYIMKLVGDQLLSKWIPGLYFLGGVSLYAGSGLMYSALYAPGFNGSVYSISIQADGQTILGGTFDHHEGIPSSKIARLNVAGSEVDPLFTNNIGSGFNNTVYTTAINNTDQTIIVGGDFTSFDGTEINRIAKLNPDGTLNTTFKNNIGSGINGIVRSIAINQSNGKYVVVGDFTTFNGNSSPRIVVLNSDGTPDTSFVVGTGLNDTAHVAYVNTDGNYLIGGAFTNYNGTTVGRIVKLFSTDGAADPTFISNAGSGFSNTVYAIENYFSSTSVLVGGSFSSYNTQTRNKIAVLNGANGILSTIFDPGTGPNGDVTAIQFHENGSGIILIAGTFTTYNTSTAVSTAFINPTGGFISAFNQSNGLIRCITQRNSIIGTSLEFLIGGDFTTWTYTVGSLKYRRTGAVGLTSGGATVTTYNDGDFTNSIINFPDVANKKFVTIDKITDARPSLKVGATHSFGIVYGDRAYRDSTVYTVDSMDLFVPWFYDINQRWSFTNFKNPFTIVPNITINHVPPVWADRYWIVAKPATEILSFGQYVTNQNQGQSGLQSSIVLDSTNNRYRIFLDSYYENNNNGASVKHEIKAGDKIRFKRTNAYYLDYTKYLELDVLGVESATGPNGEKIINTTIFESNLIEPQITLTSGNYLFGQELEIYTPRPSLDESGNILISTWKDVTEAISIINPHTESRSHGSPVQYYLQWSPNVFSGSYFYINGDQGQLLGTTWPITIYSVNGDISSDITFVSGATYDETQNATRLDLSGVAVDPTISYITFNGQDQVVNNLTNITPAYYPINYGDVYIRQRNHSTGYNGDKETFYYYQEDPNYSDYWSSEIYNTGRFRFEDQNAKMVHRKASSIHSDSFIVGTQINGLSSFGLDNQNIEDMNPLYGEIVRTYMSGREGKTLKCLQPKRENSIYIQYYPNEVGSDSSVRVSNKTFASWFDYKSLFGCTDAGATALLPNGAVMYFDNNSGVFIYSGGNGQIMVSEIDPDTGKDYKFRTKTKQLAKAYNESPNPVVRTYVNETVGEVGFAFKLQKIDLIGTEVNPDQITYDEESFISNDGSQYQINDFIEIIDIESGNVLYTGNVIGIIANIIRVGPDPIWNTIPADTAVINRSRYVYYNDHVVFDYVNMRWRSTYDYNFIQFCNFGQTLVGWGDNNQLYLHNQPGEWTFHGEPFIQKVKFVSNENPLLLKRYQDITLISDDKFSIEAVSEPNRNYPLGMKTMMSENLLGMFEGYGKTNYRKNVYDPKFWIPGNVSTTSSNTWKLNGNQTALDGEMITIVQDDKNVYTGIINNPVYSSGPNTTEIELVGLEPNTYGVEGKWYLSEKVLLNGEDMRANALTHTLSYDPSPGGVPGEGSILFSVAIKGVLS